MAQDEWSERSGTKAARNEGRKLVAMAANNFGVAFFLAALIQPALLYLQRREPVDYPVVLAIVISMLLGGLSFLIAHAVVRRLED